ncbi:MAG: hypothetical protein Q4A16_08300 [Lautropia sp.]|nr:hypothetical protein [Lautropia sp.]
MNHVLASNVPGRVRLRGQELRQPHILEAATRLLEAIPGVVEVQTNHRVGSLLMRYDSLRLPQPRALEQLETVLQRLRQTDARQREGGTRHMAGSAFANGGAGNGHGKTVDAKAGASTAVLHGVPHVDEVHDEAERWQPAWQRAYPPSSVPSPGSCFPQARTFVSVPGNQADKTDVTDARILRQTTVGHVVGKVAPVLGNVAQWMQTAGRHNHGKGRWQRTANRYAKRGMMLSLGSSLGLAVAGAKHGHIVSGSAFVAALGVHLLVHRKTLLK